jgi:hypothetical protein
MDGLFTDGLPVALGSFRVAVDAFAFGFAFVLVAFFAVGFLAVFAVFFLLFITSRKRCAILRIACLSNAANGGDFSSLLCYLLICRVSPLRYLPLSDLLF